MSDDDFPMKFEYHDQTMLLARASLDPNKTKQSLIKFELYHNVSTKSSDRCLQYTTPLTNHQVLATLDVNLGKLELRLRVMTPASMVANSTSRFSGSRRPLPADPPPPYRPVGVRGDVAARAAAAPSLFATYFFLMIDLRTLQRLHTKPRLCLLLFTRAFLSVTRCMSEA